MALRWRWLLVALAAMTVGCLVPGPMVPQLASSPQMASIEATATKSSGSECAAVACNRGSPSAPLPPAPVALAEMLAAAALFLLLMHLVRRCRTKAEPLPEGNPLRLLRPPQLSFSL